MTLQLSSLIHQIRSANTTEEENHIISTELANIRTYIRECDPDMRPRLISKLIYLNMLDQNTSCGQMECLNLMADDRFSYKRIGYLGANLLLDETADVTVLLTHSIQKDLQSQHRFVVSLALSVLSNIGSTELCRSLAGDVGKVLEIDDPFLRKRAAMAAIRIIKKIPDFSETFEPSVSILISDPAHSVKLAGVGLLIAILKSQPNLISVEKRSSYASTFSSCLRALSTSRSVSEVSDPFLQVRILEALSLLKCPSDDLDNVLALLLSTVDLKRTNGRSILLQAVQTIVSTGKQASIRTLGLTQLGRLLSFKESNVIYSALNVFSKVLYANRDLQRSGDSLTINQANEDLLALQRYKSLIIKCLNNPDISIRRRALDVISALINRDNVEQLVPEVLKYMQLADADFRMELIGRVFTALQEFSPSDQWNFDAIVQILSESGGYVKSDIISSVCNVVASSKIMQSYAVQRLQEELAEKSSVQPLVQVAAWILGEYATDDAGTTETLRKILELPQTAPDTKGYILTALAKISAREDANSPGRSESLEILAENAKSNNLDLQQRAGEYSALLSAGDLAIIAPSVLAPIPSDESEQKNVQVHHQENNDLIGDLLEISEPKKESVSLIDMLTEKPVEKPKVVVKQGMGVEVLNRDGVEVYMVAVKKVDPVSRNVAATLCTRVVNMGRERVERLNMRFDVSGSMVRVLYNPKDPNAQPEMVKEIAPGETKQIYSYWMIPGQNVQPNGQISVLANFFVEYSVNLNSVRESGLVPFEVFNLSK